MSKTLSKYCSQLKNDNKKALVTYITAGIKNWKEAIGVCVENGADIIEVGLPFSDPTMDGPIIAKASYKSIEDGSHTLELLSELSKESYSKPLVAMTYYNVLYSHGLDLSVESCLDAKISGLIIPDLSYEESHVLDSATAKQDLAHIQLVSSTTSNERQKSISQNSEGFLYAIALKGITGQEVNFDSETIDFIKDIKDISTQPSYCGIGIKTPEQAKEISKYCDGIIVGSSIVEKLMNNPDDLKDLGDFVKSLRVAIDG